MAKRNWLKYAPMALTILVIVSAVLVSVFMKGLFFKEEIEQKKMVQQITIVAAPPPPPPPPPEQIEKPEVQEQEMVEDTPDEAPPDDGPDESIADDLGLDADGTAGSDSFGLKARKGGHGLLAGGGYKSVVKARLSECLQQDDRLKMIEYSGLVTMKIGDDGKIENFVFKQESGAKQAAAYIEEQLLSHCNMKRSRPLEAKPVFQIRLTNSFSSDISFN